MHISKVLLLVAAVIYIHSMPYLGNKRKNHKDHTTIQTEPGIQINRIFNIDIDIANFEKSILILLGQYIAKY